ncbi:hypothetical protein LCGC14_2923350 [marine sediment metagenome]|uniref:Uncharacterized protein n=1 Tax=marine sediment metagenome TaxID=412755 RepID=A0A0F8XN99_9ZZZZ
MNETHAQITGRTLTLNEAKVEPIPNDFEGECSGFPERVLSFGGWVYVGIFCYRHDWHYTILRENLLRWNSTEFNEFRRWADLLLFLSIVEALKKKFYFDWLAKLLAQLIFRTVRSKIGELAAMGAL